MGLNFDFDLSNIPSMDLQIGSDVGAGIDVDAAIAAAFGNLNIPDVSGFTTPQDVQGLIGQEIGGLVGQFSTPQSVQEAIQAALGGFQAPQQDVSGFATTEQLGQQKSSLLDMLTGGLGDIKSFFGEKIEGLSDLFGGKFESVWSSIQDFIDSGAFDPQDQPTPEGMTSEQITDLVNTTIAQSEAGSIGGPIEESGINQPGFTPGPQAPPGVAPGTSFAPPSRRYEDWAYNLGYFPQPQAFSEGQGMQSNPLVQGSQAGGNIMQNIISGAFGQQSDPFASGGGPSIINTSMEAREEWENYQGQIGQPEARPSDGNFPMNDIRFWSSPEGMQIKQQEYDKFVAQQTAQRGAF